MTTDLDISFEEIFNNTVDMMCVANLDGYFLKISPSWTRILGWTRDELLSRPFLDFVHSDDISQTIQVIERLQKDNEIVDFENRYRTKSGGYVWMQWRAHADEQDANIIYATARDVTQAKYRDFRIANDIRLLELAEQTAKVGHWNLDRQSGLLDWSNEVYSILNRRPNQRTITLDDFLDAFQQRDGRTLWHAIDRATQSGQEIDLELNLNNNDASGRTVIVRAFCEKDAMNQIVGLFGIVQDVTEERKRQSSLRQKEELLSMAFRATSDGIWDWDLQTDQIWFSSQWKAQLGYDDHEIANSFDSWNELIFEEDRLKALSAMQAHSRGETDRYEMILRFRHKEGHTVFVLSRGYAVRNDVGQPLRMVGAHTNVTELKRLEQAKSEFTSIVSHELRTPLTAIHGAIGLLHGHYAGELPEQMRKLIKIANNNSERLTLLVNDILDMEKLQLGRMDFDLHDITLGDFIHNAIESHIAYAKKFQVELEYDETNDDLIVIGDSARLMQVMSNLLSNAIKFSNPGDSVKIRAHPQMNQVAISVIDIGRGIPQDKIHKIFDKFYQADSSDNRHKGGTGLGLAITKAMVEHMNGEISVVSKLGEGSIFTVRLPRGENRLFS